MSVPRRFLPSISSLRALEAVDRLGSAVAAADDLNLTHSAVSRQLRTLQDQLGVTLFLREGKGLRLTLAGRSYARSVRDYLDDLAQASLQLRAAGEKNSLSLAIPLTFGLCWMAPHLQGFLRAHPDILINQATRNSIFDFAAETFDMAVHFGVPDWPGVNYLPLAANRLVPVAAAVPEWSSRPAAGDMLHMPLLHLTSRPGAWESWFLQQGESPGHLRGMLFDQFLALAEAASAGLGAALLPDFLADREIACGRLTQVGPTFEDPGSLYYLVWPRESEPSQELHLLIDWLRARSEVVGLPSA